MEEVINDSATEDGEGVEGDNETPVIEEDVVEEETPVVEDEVASDEETPEETPAENYEVTSVTPNALVPSELKVTVVEPDKSEGAAAGATKALESAEIVYTNGCVSADGKLRKNADITFKLLPNAGKKLSKVQYKTKEAKEGATESAASDLTASDETYTIPRTALMHEVTVGDKKETVNDVNVTIVVTTDDIKYTVKPVATGYKLYELKTENSTTVADLTNEITAKAIAYADKDKEISVAVVKEADITTKIRSVSVKAGSEGTAKVITSTEETDDTAKYPIYTFKPSELAGIAENVDQDITITVEATALAEITIVKKVDDGAILEAVVDDAEVYTPAAVVQAATAAKANEGQKVIFAVKMDEAYKALAEGDVTAALDEEPITVTKVDETAKTDDADKKTKTHYMIDLAAATTAATLTITVKTELDAAKDDVKSISFVSVSQNSVEIIKNGDTTKKDLTGTTVKTKQAAGSKYAFDVKADPGYQIYRIDAVYEKTYTSDDAEATPPAKKTVTEPLGDETLKVEGNVAQGATSLSNLEISFNGTEIIEDVSYKWTTKAVTINVYSKMDTFKTAKEIIFANPEYDYEVTTGDKVEFTDDDRYTVKPDADFFTFTVDAVTEPVVTTEIGEDENTVNLTANYTEKTEAGYVYKIPAAALGDKQSIEITRKTDKKITVNYEADDVDLEVEKVGKAVALGKPADTENGIVYTGVTADYTYKFIIAAKDNAQIAKVSYKVGKEEATEVTAKGGSYVFNVDVTGNVEVNVEMVNEYELVVTEKVGETDTVVSPDKSKVYNVGHASTVKAKLLKGTNVAPLFNAEVKDGNAVAATIAKISDNIVTLEFDSSEYNKVLTVVLTLNDKTKSTREFKVKTTAAAAEVSLTGVKNGKVDLPVDTKASYKLTVKTKNATLDGIDAIVVPADDTKKADTTEITKARNAVSAAIENGNLVITAAPAKEGAENAAKVVLVDKSGLSDAEITALTVDNALRGGVVTVNTKDATIVGKNPTVSLVSTTDKDIKVQITTPKDVVNPVVGNIYYKVEVTAPATLPDTLPAAVKTAITNAVTAWNAAPYKLKTEIDGQGGLLSIPVITADDVKGVRLSGFSVKVTLLQTTTAEGLPSADATTITGGTATLSNIETKDPYYEVKLGLKKGTTTLITGQDKDVTVATPNFNKLTSYSYVTVEFVDTSTGKVYEGTPGDGYTTVYHGLYAKYNTLQNAVIVNAKGANYVNYSYYKNLGVKVTAFAENSAYGAVATQKITVVNGIQDINPSAPREVYKADNKAATLTVTTDLNNAISYGNKNYAPKTKKLDYKIVAADYDPESAAPGADPAAGLPDDIKAYVTVKNGKVTIAKGYIPAPKEAQNQFKVMVSAADYAGNPIRECTDEITITGEGLQMGEIAVFDSNGLKGAGTATIEAANRSGEYQVRVLNPDVKTTKKSYVSTDFVESDLLTFKSSNAKSVAVDELGRLTIYKAAKNVKITAIPKDGSNPKPVKTLTLTVGQVASATPLLKITRYEDSTLSTQTVMNANGEKELTYDGNSTNNYFKLEVVKEVTKNNKTTYEPFYLANYSITYKGAKKINQYNNDNGDEITIVANAKEATITLKDKAAKNSTPVVYKLVNNSFVDAKGVTAPKIATTAKLTQKVWAGNVYYTVKGGKDDNFTGKYVMLSIDRTKKNPSDIAEVFKDYNNYNVSYLDKPLPILLGTGFNLFVDTYYAGNYNLVATVGSLENGVFKPEYKDAKVVVKIAKQGNTNLSATGNYTLSMKNQSGARINYKSGTGWAVFTNLELTDDQETGEEIVVEKNYAKNAIINGQENHFRDYFEARCDKYGNGMTIALKSDLPLTAPADKPDAPALDKITGNDATAKNNRIGYISINNGVKYIDVKLTITLKDYTVDKTKYKVTATPVLEGPKAVSALTVMEGKSRVNIAWILVASENKLFKAVFDRSGNLYLEATKAIEKGTYPVDLYIIPWNAPKAYRDAAAAATEANQLEVFEKYGVKTSIKVTAADKATTKNKVVLAKGGNTWNVADTDYNANGANWSRYTSFSFKNKLSLAETTSIAAKATVNNADIDYVTFSVYSDAGASKYMTYETVGDKTYISLPTNYGMNITLDKAKLTKAITDNKALEANKQNKNLDWGKTLKVKAAFSYGENGPAADEVTFSIKLPANAGADDAAVTTALTDEAFNKKLQSDIETYTKGLEGDYYDDEDINYINSLVGSYIRNAINKAIKGASVTVLIENNGSSTVEVDGVTTTTKQVASEWTVTVTSTTAKDPENTAKYKELYKHVFTIPTLKGANDVATAITNLSLNSTVEIKNDEGKTILKVSAKTTAKEFADAVRTKLGAAATRNISITAVIVGTPEEPTTEKTGSISFKLTVKDLSKAPSEYGYKSGSEIDVVYTIPKLDDLDACKTKITDATNGLNAAKLTEIVRDAYKEVKKTDATLDAKVKDMILAEANKLITNNPAITVDSFAKKTDPATEDDFSFTKPTSAANKGKISFKLQLTETGKTAEQLAADSYKVTIVETDLNAIAEFQTTTELLNAAKAITQIDYAADQDAALAAIKAEIVKLSKNPAYDAATEVKVEATTGETEASSNTAFKEASTSETGSITNVKISTSDSDTDTISSVTIAKKPATPAE